MTYSTRADVEERLAALPDSGEEPVLDSRVTAGIEYADSLIDSKLALRYKVPFSPVPKLIKNISADLATAFALNGGFSGGGEDEEPSLANQHRKWAMKLLCDLAKGEMVLPPAEAPPPLETESAVVPNHSKLGQRPSLEDFDLYNEPGRWNPWSPL